MKEEEIQEAEIIESEDSSNLITEEKTELSDDEIEVQARDCLLYTSPSPRDS